MAAQNDADEPLDDLEGGVKELVAENEANTLMPVWTDLATVRVACGGGLEEESDD